MSELQIIEATLEKTAQRRRWQRAWAGFWRGLLFGGSLWLVTLIAYKLFPIPVEALLGAGGVAFVLAVIGFALGWSRKPGQNETARWVDSQTQSQERLSTALEVARNTRDTEWRRLLVSDAAARAQQLDPKKMLPFSLPSASRWALLVLALSAGLGFVPEYRTKEFLQKKAEAQVIKEVGRQVAELTKRQMDARPPALQTTQKAMESVAELGQRLQNAKLTRTDALHDLASVTDKVKQQARDLVSSPAFKRMEEAARSPSAENGRPGEGLQKQIESLQKALGDKNVDPAKLDKLAKELKKLQDAVAGMADKSDNSGASTKEQLSQSLASLTKQAQDMGLNMPGLEAAMAALAANQTDLFVKDMNMALTDLEKMRDMAKSLQQLQAQAERIGKDLAEQLKNGQAQAAQSTLQKMIEQLKQGNVSKEQLDNMLKEVSKAVDPAGQYGKVAQYLKDAAKQLQQGEKGEGAKSLADAKKELDDLMKQMGDAQNLMASLEALEKAQMCVGNCTGWGQCQSKGGFNPKGSKAGRGVGTWADDESGWLYTPEITERWDNTGVVRPDMEGRGVTDRGAGQLADNLQSTKIRGQMSPGGSMPSITLKGVSIKGSSSVAYEEAVSTAQSEAQSALSQEKVPRAYQGAVRDYFDDLKK